MSIRCSCPQPRELRRRPVPADPSVALTRWAAGILGLSLALLPAPGATQRPPAGEQARLFAPGVISTGAYELNAAFEADGRTVYFTRTNPRFPFPNSLSVILVSRRQGEQREQREQRKQGEPWGRPEVVSFSGIYDDLDPYLSPDGQRLYFMSNRPRPGAPEPTPGDFDLWFVEREDDGWGEPRHTGPSINSDAMEGYPAPVRDGSLYFFSTRASADGPADLYRAASFGASWQSAENLGSPLNSPGLESNLYVDPDETYMIFASSRTRPEDPFGDLDLYVSFRRDGRWSEPESLGDRVNTPGWEFTPMVTPDGRTLFFSRALARPDDRFLRGRAVTSDEHGELVGGPGNGLGDIYSIELAVLRPEWREGPRGSGP